MRVLILGRTEELYATAQLLRGEHEICGIITAPAAAEYTKDEQDFEQLAGELGCPFLCARTLGPAALELIQQARPEVAVSLNWVSVVDKQAAELFPHGILNAHYADLPSYRGNAVANWAILRGETRLPLTVHYMAPGELDSGDILVQHWVELTPSTTIADVLKAGRQHVPRLFADVLRQMGQGTLTPVQQSSTGKPAFRCYPRLPADSRIDWNWSASEIDALVRASGQPYSGAYSYMLVDGLIRKVTVWSSRLVATETADVGTPGHVIRNDASSGESWVYTGDGIIALSSIQYDELPPFAPGATWRSIRIRFGVDVEAELIRLQREIADLKARL
jgi:methionyl-tRNA formyltransferase